MIEAFPVALRKADHVKGKRGEFLAHRLFVEDAQDAVLAMHRGHDRDAEVDLAALVTNAEAAVLRNPPLGDIELAHDLDARNDRLVPILRDRRHGVVQNAVDAVLDGDFGIPRLDVDVAGAPFERVEDRRIDQTDDRRDVGIAGQLVDGKGLAGVFGANDVENEALGDFFENALRLLGFLQQIVDLRQRRDVDAQLLAQQQGDFVQFRELPRVGDGDFQRAVPLHHGHEVVAEHQIDGDRPEQVAVDVDVIEIDVAVAVAGRDFAGMPFLVFSGDADRFAGRRHAAAPDN